MWKFFKKNAIGSHAFSLFLYYKKRIEIYIYIFGWWFWAASSPPSYEGPLFGKNPMRGLLHSLLSTRIFSTNRWISWRKFEISNKNHIIHQLFWSYSQVSTIDKAFSQSSLPQILGASSVLLKWLADAINRWLLKTTAIFRNPHPMPFSHL